MLPYTIFSHNRLCVVRGTKGHNISEPWCLCRNSLIEKRGQGLEAFHPKTPKQPKLQKQAKQWQINPIKDFKMLQEYQESFGMNTSKIIKGHRSSAVGFLSWPGWLSLPRSHRTKSSHQKECNNDRVRHACLYNLPLQPGEPWPFEQNKYERHQDQQRDTDPKTTSWARLAGHPLCESSECNHQEKPQ